MTASPYRHLLTRLLAIALTLIVLGAGGPARAQGQVQDRVKGEVRVENANGFIRLVFRFDKPVPAQVKLAWPVMVIEFTAPVAVAVGKLNAAAPQLIGAARSDPDGKALRIALSQKVKLNTITAAERFYVDLMPENWSGVLPGLPQEVVEELAERAREAERQLKRQHQQEVKRKAAPIRVRVATQPTFTRYVLDLPDSANVVPERGDGRYTLSFDQPIQWDLGEALSALPPTLTTIEASNERDAGTVSFVFNGTPDVRSFREDRSIVVDVSHDGAKLKIAAAANERHDAPKVPDLTAIPAIAPPATVPAKEEPAPAPEVKPAAPPAAVQEEAKARRRSQAGGRAETGAAAQGAGACQDRQDGRAARAQAGRHRRAARASIRRQPAARISLRGADAGRRFHARRNALAGVRQRRQDRHLRAHRPRQ